MDGSQVYTLRKKPRTLIWIHTGQNTVGNVRSLITNHETEFKSLAFGPIRQ